MSIHSESSKRKTKPSTLTKQETLIEADYTEVKSETTEAQAQLQSPPKSNQQIYSHAKQILKSNRKKTAPASEPESSNLETSTRYLITKTKRQRRGWRFAYDMYCRELMNQNSASSKREKSAEV